MNRRIIVLGTGAAMVTKHYQASFIVEYDGLRMLVDTMGGYDIYRALQENEYSLFDLNTLFISHRHLDHSMGFTWIVRLIRFGEKNNKINETYQLKVLCSPLVKKSVIAAAEALCPNYWEIAKKYMEFVDLEDYKDIDIEGVKITSLDQKSKKEEQYGFVMESNSYKLFFTGDVPFREEHKDIAMDSDLLIHESFCLDSEEEKYGAHEKAHSTAKEAGLNASLIRAKQLVLIHVADENPNRKERFTEEAKLVFSGQVYMPEDKEIINLV